MFDHLTGIYDPRERAVVGVADAALAAVARPLRVFGRQRHHPPRRILLLRLERIGDLLMSLGAIRAVRQCVPGASIDLIVGSWNEPVARTIGEVDRVEVLDAPWLSRGGPGMAISVLASRATAWRKRKYDLAINFEGDIRSHLLMAASRAPRRVGFAMAGGGPVLTDLVPHDPERHTAASGLRLVECAFDLSPGSLADPFDPVSIDRWRIDLPEAARREGDARLAALGLAPGSRPIVAMHVSGGRAIKQWPVERFAEVARALSASHGAAILLTGTPDDRALVETAARALADVPDVHAMAGALDLLTLGAVLARCALVVTGDTGPMHLAAAVRAPIVAVFGPSAPDRYGPLAETARIVRIDLPCSPCNRVRKPPARCVGHTPDCLEGIATARVVEAALDVLGRAAAPAAAQRA